MGLDPLPSQPYFSKVFKKYTKHEVIFQRGLGGKTNKRFISYVKIRQNIVAGVVIFFNDFIYISSLLSFNFSLFSALSPPFSFFLSFSLLFMSPFISTVLST